MDIRLFNDLELLNASAVVLVVPFVSVSCATAASLSCFTTARVRVSVADETSATARAKLLLKASAKTGCSVNARENATNLLKVSDRIKLSAFDA